MVQYRRGRRLMLFSAALSCGAGLALAGLGVLELRHQLPWHHVDPQPLVLACYGIGAAGALMGLVGAILSAQTALARRVIFLNSGMLLAMGLMALSSETEGRFHGFLTLAAGCSVLIAATSFVWKRSRA